MREFVLGVLLVPTLATFLWFSVMGGSALYRQMSGGEGGLVGKDGTLNSSTALFSLLESMPGAPVLCGLFLLLIVIFFVTSSDSGSFVVYMLASGGDENPPVRTRIFWSLLEGGVAAALLWVGARRGALTDGLVALQTMSILVAAPLSLVMIAMCVASARYLHRQVNRRRAADGTVRQPAERSGRQPATRAVEA